MAPVASRPSSRPTTRSQPSSGSTLASSRLAGSPSSMAVVRVGSMVNAPKGIPPHIPGLRTHENSALVQPFNDADVRDKFEVIRSTETRNVARVAAANPDLESVSTAESLAASASPSVGTAVSTVVTGALNSKRKLADSDFKTVVDDRKLVKLTYFGQRPPVVYPDAWYVTEKYFSIPFCFFHPSVIYKVLADRDAKQHIVSEGTNSFEVYRIDTDQIKARHGISDDTMAFDDWNGAVANWQRFQLSRESQESKDVDPSFFPNLLSDHFEFFRTALGSSYLFPYWRKYEAEIRQDFFRSGSSYAKSVYYSVWDKVRADAKEDNLAKCVGPAPCGLGLPLPNLYVSSQGSSESSRPSSQPSRSYKDKSKKSSSHKPYQAIQANEKKKASAENDRKVYQYLEALNSKS